MDNDIVYSINSRADSFDIPREEILRYMASGGDESSAHLIDELLAEAVDSFLPKASYVRLRFGLSGSEFILGNTRFCSASLAGHIAGCSELIVLSLSLGHALDRLISRYSALRPSAAFCINAIGAAAIESYADKVCKAISDDLEKEGLHLSERFSPGYGDLPLDIQKDLIRMSDAGRRVGISLNKSRIMSPSKSVTAIIGISPCDIQSRGKSCINCKKYDCIYRRKAQSQ